MCFVKNKSNKSVSVFSACKLCECVWFVQKFDEFIMFIFSMLYYLDTDFCVIVYRRMSVIVLVFIWRSSCSSPNVVTLLMV